MSVPKKLPRVLTTAEMQAILDACDHLRDRFLLALLHDSGCRIGEALGFSRSWLYSQPDIRTEIERLRHTTGRSPSPPIPADQRTSDASLLTRLESAIERNRTLTAENQRLRRQLAHALGNQRASPH